MAMSPQELAQAVRDEQMSFEDALLYHLLNNLGIAIKGVGLFLALILAVGWAQMGRWQEIVNLPSGPLSVRHIIKRYDLLAFVEM